MEITTAAATLLNHLERVERTDEYGELPIQYIMLRIRDLLSRQLARQITLDTAAATTTNSNSTTTTSMSDTNTGNSGSRESTSGGETARRNTDRDVMQFKRAVAKIAESSSPLTIDILMLQSSEGDIIKEFAASCRGCPTACITVKAPHASTPKIRENRYAIDRIHGIPWDCGLVTEAELQRITARLFVGSREIRVKSLDKINTLAKRLELPASRFEEIGQSPSLRTLLETYVSERCTYHRLRRPGLSCAMRQADVLMKNSEPWN